MSGEAPLIEAIEGYQISVWKENGMTITIPLKLTKVGGAHITNADSLVMMIEDAVFKEENSGDSG